MESQTNSVDADADERAELSVPRVTAHETVPGRAVFTESGNTDGWIATDLTVDVRS